MMRKIVIILTMFLTVSAAGGQENGGVQEPDSAMDQTELNLPTLNVYGQVPTYINSWTLNHFMGFHNWDLHKGLNMNLGACVFTGLGDYAPSGAGFAQNITGMYALPLTKRLSLAFGGYMVNADWGGINFRDVGLNAVLGYRFNDHWQGFIYGQKSLMEPKVRWPYYNMNELGDRIGAAIRYNFNPAFYVQLKIEYGTNRYTMPPFGRQDGEEPTKAPF